MDQLGPHLRRRIGQRDNGALDIERCVGVRLHLHRINAAGVLRNGIDQLAHLGTHPEGELLADLLLMVGLRPGEGPPGQAGARDGHGCDQGDGRPSAQARRPHCLSIR